MTNDFTVSGYVELTAQIHCTGCHRKVHFSTSLPPESVRTGNTTERTRERDEAYEHIARMPAVIDHACPRCVPGGPGVHADFVCVRHVALEALGR